MNQQQRAVHGELLLACFRAEALADRMDDAHFRAYIIDLTSHLDLPEPRPVLSLVDGGAR